MVHETHDTKHTRGARAGGLADERGSVLLMVTVAMLALFAFAAIAIDGAVLMTTRTQLNAAADAAALAGASGLVNGTRADAVDRAIKFASYNRAYRVQQNPVIITADDVTFPEPDVVRVRTHRTVATGDPLRTFFMRLVDPSSNRMSEMTAVAAAKAYDVCSSRCLKPWSIPDRWHDENNNGAWDPGELYDPDATGYNAPADVGTRIVLKEGSPQQTIAPGVYFIVDYPPLDNPDGIKPYTGADMYKRWITECVPYMVGVGDRLQIEPGNKVGPTVAGVLDELIKSDPGAYWDEASQTVQGSTYALSPRIGLIPFFDPTLPPRPGRSFVVVIKLGAFFIESVGPGSQVNGRFINVTVQGSPCPGGPGASFVKSIALVE